MIYIYIYIYIYFIFIYINILYILYIHQGQSIIFPTKELKTRVNFPRKVVQILRKFWPKLNAPQRKIRCLKLSDALKLSSKQAELHSGIHLFNWVGIFFGGGEGGEVKPRNPAGCYDPVYIYIAIVLHNFAFLPKISLLKSHDRFCLCRICFEISLIYISHL